MTCTQAQDLIQLYVDKRLNLARTRSLERHLAHCQNCRAELMLLEDISEGIHSLAHVSEPDWLADAVMARIAATTAAQPPLETSRQLYGQKQRAPRTVPFRLSGKDIALSCLLATLALLSFILAVPALRNALGALVNPLAALLLNGLMLLFSPDAGLLGLVAWALWIVLGIGITWLVAGSEIRSLWRQRIRAWLPEAWR
jgi:anti-sigma factor RsiW